MLILSRALKCSAGKLVADAEAILADASLEAEGAWMILIRTTHKTTFERRFLEKCSPIMRLPTFMTVEMGRRAVAHSYGALYQHFLVGITILTSRTLA